MQELSVQPTNPTPYTPAGGTYNNNPVPGAGGLPSLSGLTPNVNPMAQQLQQQGRGEDSMLVHMTPDEVNSLRGLAQKFGGDLTTNPNTGLPEAGWLGKLLPTILGIAGAAVGIPTWAIGAGVGVGQTALTGDLNKGLMAGLQAFGGATLAGSMGVGQAPVTSAIPEAGANLAPGAATSAATSGLTVPADIAAMGAPAATPTLANTALQTAAPSIASQAPTTLLAPGMGAQATPGFFSRFGNVAREGMKAGTIPYKVAPMAAGLGTLSALSDVTAPQMPKYEPEENKWKYEGPYLPAPRSLRPRVQGEGEISFFDVTNPLGYMTRSGEMRYAEGGTTEAASPSPVDMLNNYTNMFQSSAGPITASPNYAGGSPSERIREAMRAAAAQTAANTATTTAGTAPATTPTARPFTGTGEADFGFPTSAGLAQYNPMGMGGPYDYITNNIAEYFRNFGGGPRDAGPNVSMNAKGGSIHMDDGAFVVDARTVSELGNGSSSAGQELLARLGGRPVKGPGDGVSDSIPANIGGTQEARVARDEVIIPAEAVRKLGGAKKLYALMDKAHKARKKAKRGEDTKVAKGLGALA